MHVAATVGEMRAIRRAMAGDVGFVPTLGSLHEGHLSLVRAARAQNEHTVVSVFVNPTQFGPGEEFERYPRDPERDLAQLRQEQVDAAFLPSVEEMYPEGASTSVTVAGLTGVLEGAHRPGHFAGVTTIVAKLFHIVQPRRAYFGRKDAQQLAVVRKMVRELRFDVEIVPMPTIREPDGLAISSRNVHLSPQERQAAIVLSRALQRAEELFTGGERDGDRLRESMHRLIADEPLAQVDYVSVADTETLQELKQIECTALGSLAVRIGSVRLIDNVTLAPQGDQPPSKETK